MGVFRKIIVFCLSLSLLLHGQTWRAIENEISLFNLRGEPVAYIALDDDFTIYLWDGTPVAYLYKGFQDVHVYSFDGEHLGWFENGIIWDHNGNAVGFIKGAVNIIPLPEPPKGLR